MPVASLTERYLEILDSCTGKEVEAMFKDKSQAEIKQAATQQFIKDLGRLFIVPTKVSLSDIAAYVQMIESEKNIKIGVIGIDYMGLMEGPGTSEYEVVSRLATGLKSTAKLLNIPVIVLAQVNRKGGGGTNEISLDMGRGSGAIEEAADFVLGLWQAENDSGEKDLICRILKNRKGPVGSCWRLDLIPQTLQIGAEAEKYESPKNTKGGF
jgi:replicative DNA helicase